ncbi:hypothetical protein CCHR01_07568 [Colletotrichum chrysophilum]|uniref:Uncharacterized protein n=1 Tax=Colletotrichum chrysophilum TaxID=1836956 RepID=A0AAD9ANG2_9PEZI|nr:hypothetical protein CCHR01_07568 [Colletotrichum chrysophilum]
MFVKSGDRRRPRFTLPYQSARDILLRALQKLEYPYWAGLVYNLYLDPSCNPSRRGPSHMQCSATRPQPFPLSLGAAPPYGAARPSTDPQSPLSVGLECIKPHCLPHRRRLDSGNATMHLFMLF